MVVRDIPGHIYIHDSVALESPSTVVCTVFLIKDSYLLGDSVGSHLVPIVFYLAALMSGPNAQRTIEYLIGTYVDTCTYNGHTSGQGNLTANGGLYAYDESVSRLYNCWPGV